MLTYREILTAIKSDIPIYDSYAKLWGEKLSNAYTTTTYTGTLPAVLTGTKAGYLHRYKVYGNLTQNGTPTPENPIYPSECGERTENVMPSAPAETKTNNGITVTCDGNGVYTLSGTSIGGSVVIFSIPEFQIPISVGQGGQGTMSLFNTLPNGQVSLAYMNNGATIDTWSINSANRKNNTYSTMSGKICNAIQFYVPNGNKCDCIIKPCFTNDSIYPANYIPFGYKLPLLSGSTPVDIYIGDDTLSTDEYVDSGTGKIYRMVDGVLTPVDPPAPFPQIPTSGGSTTISWAGEGIPPSQVEFIYKAKR